MTLILSGTDGLSDVDGSAATPAIRGTDANTGIFFGTDIIGFSEGGVEAMRIDASGNVGIGSSPAATSRLQVSSTGSTRLLVENTTNSVQLRIQTLTATALIQTDTNHALTFATNNGAEAMRINAGAPILCLAGGSTTATGTGIAFPATQSASSDANTLDDYEEGTFTPSFSSSGSVTYATRTASYIKIGRLVQSTIALELSAISSPTGALTITGLPFTSGSGEQFVSAITVGLARYFASVLTITGYIGSASTTLQLSKNASNANFTALQGSDLTSSTLFYVSLTYMTA